MYSVGGHITEPHSCGDYISSVIDNGESDGLNLVAMLNALSLVKNITAHLQAE